MAGFRINSARFANRMDKETSMTVLLPDNPVARESVTRYLATMKSVYVRVADGGGAAPLPDVAEGSSRGLDY